MASPIRMTGINSGLDTESIVTALTSGYKSKVDKYKQQQTKVSWKQDAWKGINKKVYSLYTSLDSMRFSSNWSLQKATSSNTAKATVTSNGKAFTGTQTLRIASVATSASMTGGVLDDSITGSSTLADLGYTDGDEASITVNGKSFKVDSSTTVNGFVSQLQNSGLNASFDSSSHRIFVSAKKSGASGDFAIEGDSNGVKVLKDLGLLSNEKSTKAQTTYQDILGNGLTYDEKSDTLVYTDGNGKLYSLNSTDEDTRKKVLDALTSNINSKVSEYNSAKTNKSTYSDNAKEIEAGLSYVRTFRSYNQELQKYGTGATDDAKKESLNTLDAAIEDLASLDDDSIMVKSGDKYEEYKIEDSKNNVYKHGNQYFKKNDDGSYSEVTGSAKDGWTEATNGTKISKDDVKTIGEYRMSSDAANLVSKALYGKDYDQLDGDDKDTKQKAVANAVVTLISQRSSLDTYENATDTTAIGDAVSGSDTNGATVKWSRSDVEKLVKGDNPDNYKPSSYDSTRISTAIGDLNKADQYWKKQAEAQDDILNGSSLVSSFAGLAAGQKDADETKYNAAVSSLVTAAQTAFANQYETNTAIGDGKAGTVNKQSGQDARIYLNGQEYTQASNNFTINGLTINVTGTTSDAETTDGKENANGESISITTQVDSQGLYDKIKNFFSTYNDVVNELTDSYYAESSKGYDPLTDDQKAQMSDTQIEKWEKKGKEGLLRNDSTLNSIMNSITNSMLGSYTINGKKYSLATFGIMTKGILNAATNRQYEYHIDGDEDDESVSSNQDKLMAAINEDPDSVISFMQKLTNDLYQNLDKKMKRTSLKTAYTVYNDKEMASEYSSYTSLIKQWEDRLSTMEDSYYQKFSKMESTLSKLQSSTSSLTSSLGR